MELHTDDKIISRQSNWVFDEHVAPEFDKHVRKSVPNYNLVQNLAETFSDWFTYDGYTMTMELSVREGLPQKFSASCKIFNWQK